MKNKLLKITSKSYGHKWRDFKIHYTGLRPSFLKDDGSFSSGKSILETLENRLKKFELTLIKGKSQIRKNGKRYGVSLAVADVRSINKNNFATRKDAAMRSIAATFAKAFPSYFDGTTPLFSYSDGLFSSILTSHFLPTRLSPADRAAFANYIPTFVASGVAMGPGGGKVDSAMVSKVLQELAKDLETRIGRDRSESIWQEYLKQNILLIQQGYIKLMSKANIGLVVSSFPDFILVTHDGYLDVLEIKTPVTRLLSEDTAHNNHYWSTDISKAIAQVENYIQAIENSADMLRNKVKDIYGIELRVIKPRGIIFAGHTNQFAGKAAVQDDFRLLNHGQKNVTVVPYDELLVRLQNHLATLSTMNAGKAKSKKVRA